MSIAMAQAASQDCAIIATGNYIVLHHTVLVIQRN